MVHMSTTTNWCSNGGMLMKTSAARAVNSRKMMGKSDARSLGHPTSVTNIFHSAA
jgi:hypothetical protein